MFAKILIANRGEIACRVAASARRLGIETVAVFSEADTDARHVALCDEAVLIGPAPARESYLRGDRIIEAALAAGAQAIHPGYGFLSENADFAEACARAGLAFIGPPAAAIRAMGSKSAAKALMETAGVPLVPGYHGDNQDPDFLRGQAAAIGYPVLLKASAGGGGKGMRIVERDADFRAALESCQREAANSFGDDRVLVEKYLTRPRHIEIQVFADSHGDCLYLFERDCSVQRRHQKVLEEAPAPGMTPERRAAMGQAAIAAAQAVGYVGAGTVEFIAEEGRDGEDGAFYFMEMNTRLQVEHPVTEMVTGLDLVEWQLRVAAGEALPKRQEALELRGHAIEARIYAENPEKGFLPSIGTVRHLRTPRAVEFSPFAGADTPGLIRIDSGIRQGDAISPHYDPMIAKLIVWGEDRQQALTLMAQALAQYQVAGLSTNIAFLKRLVESQPFSRAELDTGLIERNQQTLLPPLQPAESATLALAAAALLAAERRDEGPDPWSRRSGWRLGSALRRRLEYADAQRSYALEVEYRDRDWLLWRDGQAEPLAILASDGGQLAIRLGGRVAHGAVVRDGDAFHVFADGGHAVLTYADPMAHAGQAESAGGGLTAPMPGKIVAVLARPGQAVEGGAPLLIMEAMKMEHTINAPGKGVVEAILYDIGEQVAEGAPLLSFKAG
ncbi:MAG: acetyl/propionyl/methylcrotonyl-CoA carboxylase subunit alpha [Noviherbaspirillum sp.]